MKRILKRIPKTEEDKRKEYERKLNERVKMVNYKLYPNELEINLKYFEVMVRDINKRHIKSFSFNSLNQLLKVLENTAKKSGKLLSVYE